MAKKNNKKVVGKGINDITDNIGKGMKKILKDIKK